MCCSESSSQIASQSEHPRQSNYVIYNFKIAAAVAQYRCHYHPKVKIYLQPKFRWRILIHGWDITTSVLQKQPSALFFFFFRFRFWPYHRTRHVTLHYAAKFRPNRSILSGDMTLCRFSRWRPLQFYFRFQIGWRRSFSDVSFYQQIKFHSYNSIRGWDITISGFEEQTSAIL